MTTEFTYVNIDLHHQYGISVTESQTFLLSNRPSVSEEKRLPFAGYFTIRSKFSMNPSFNVSKVFAICYYLMKIKLHYK